MKKAELLKEPFQTNLWVIEHQCEGLTHADSLLQFPHRGNCLNWVLGHILVSRDGLLKTFGHEPLLSEEMYQRYKFDSEPVTEDGDDILSLEELLACVKKSQELLIPAIEKLTDEEIDTIPEDSERTLGQRISFIGWHEGYHMGQLEIHRQLAGKNDKVI